MSQLISINLHSTSSTQISLPPHPHTLHITHATVLPPTDSRLNQSSDEDADEEADFAEDDAITDASYLIRAHTDTNTIIVLGRVDLEQTQLTLDIQCSNVTGKNLTFDMLNENPANEEKWSVALSGYITLSGSNKPFDLQQHTVNSATTTSQVKSDVNGKKRKQTENNEPAVKKQHVKSAPVDAKHGNPARRDASLFSEEDSDNADVNGGSGIESGAEADDASMDEQEAVKQAVKHVKQKQQQPTEKPAAAADVATPKPAAKPAVKAEKPKTPQIVKLKGGLEYKVSRPGDGGKTAKNGSLVSIRYRGQLLNGTVFDSNLPKGKPLTFTVGNGDVIKGFEQGVTGMSAGEVRMVNIPAHLGYGARGAMPDIPPNSTLVFEIHMLKTT